jgi:SAM-dependent methyltransferase
MSARFRPVQAQSVSLVWANAASRPPADAGAESEAVSAPAYDRIGLSYSEVRRADPRFEAAIWNALGDAKSVLNIGAGAGSYEPSDRGVIAVEPSPVMIAQRPADAAPAIQGVAESLPLKDKSVDATMGVFTMQHWDDVDRGLAEVLRVTRKRIVFLTLDLDVTAEMWLCRDYLPEIVEHDRETFPSIAHLEAILPGLQAEVVPVPADCTDGFCVALWSQPETHLDPGVRRASSTWHLLPPSVVDSGLGRLRADLEGGEWDRRYGQLRTQAALDVGLRLVKVELR